MNVRWGEKRQHVQLLFNIRHKSDKIVVAAEGYREQDPLASEHAGYLSTLDTREHVETDDCNDYKMYKWIFLIVCFFYKNEIFSFTGYKYDFFNICQRECKLVLLLLSCMYS